MLQQCLIAVLQKTNAKIGKVRFKHHFISYIGVCVLYRQRDLGNTLGTRLRELRIQGDKKLLGRFGCNVQTLHSIYCVLYL